MPSSSRFRLHRLLSCVLLLAAVWLAPVGAVQALPAPLQLAHGQPSASLDGLAEYWVDPSGTLSAAAASQVADGQWAALHEHSMVGQASPAATWLRFRVQTNDSDRWFLELPHATLFRGTLYEIGSDGAPGRTQASGVLVPYSTWPMHSHRLVFELQANATQPGAYLLRLEHPVAVGGVPVIRSTDDLLHSQSWAYGLMGAYFGLALLALCYITLLAVIHREPPLIWCAIYLVTVIATMATTAGLLHQTPLGELPALSVASLLLMPVLLGAVGLCYLVAVVPQVTIGLAPRIVTWALVILGIAIACAFYWLPVPSAWYLSRGYVSISGVWALALLLSTLRWRLLHARWLTLGVAAMLLGGSLPLLKGFGLLPSGLGAQYGMLIGGAIELPLLLYAMSLLRRDQDVVAARVREGRQYDRLTGLLLPQALMPRLAQMALRSKRHRIRSAVVLFELVNLRDIRLRQGENTADEALVLAGRLLQRGVRATDAVVRFQETQFVALLDGVANAAEALSTVLRIIREGQRYTGELPGAETLELQAAMANLPQDLSGTPEALMADLQALLARMHPGTGVPLRQLNEVRRAKVSPWQQWRATAPAHLHDLTGR